MCSTDYSLALGCRWTWSLRRWTRPMAQTPPDPIPTQAWICGIPQAIVTAAAPAEGCTLRASSSQQAALPGSPVSTVTCW